MARGAAWVLVLTALTLNLVRFVSLEADFPAGLTTSRALYTDEGWYSMNAVAIARGQPWYTPGELNTMVSLPVVPLLQSAAFHFLGPGLVAARALAGVAAVVLVAGTAWLA